MFILYKEQIKHLQGLGQWPAAFTDTEESAPAAAEPADDMPSLEGLELGSGSGSGSGSDSDGGLPELLGNPNRRKFAREGASESESASASEGEGEGED